MKSKTEIHPKSEEPRAQAVSAPDGLDMHIQPTPKPVPPGLYLVATPIGNLRDITLRALDVLRAADFILAEDTRTSAKLMQAYGITTPLTAYHDHNAAKRVPGVIKKLNAAATVALISDAGTPMVSDPGHKLVSACANADIRVYPIPGASSVLAALVCAGLSSDRFIFIGFLPPKSGARTKALSALTSVPASLVFFETVPRIAASLDDMRTVFGDRPAAICRELTKTYEEVIRGTLSTLKDDVTKVSLRGEIVVVVDAPSDVAKWSEQDILNALRSRIPAIGVKRASAEIAEMSGHKKRDVYTLALLQSDDKV